MAGSSKTLERIIRTRPWRPASVDSSDPGWLVKDQEPDRETLESAPELPLTCGLPRPERDDTLTRGCRAFSCLTSRFGADSNTMPGGPPATFEETTVPRHLGQIGQAMIQATTVAAGGVGGFLLGTGYAELGMVLVALSALLPAYLVYRVGKRLTSEEDLLETIRVLRMADRRGEFQNQLILVRDSLVSGRFRGLVERGKEFRCNVAIPAWINGEEAMFIAYVCGNYSVALKALPWMPGSGCIGRAWQQVGGSVPFPERKDWPSNSEKSFNRSEALADWNLPEGFIIARSRSAFIASAAMRDEAGKVIGVMSLDTTAEDEEAWEALLTSVGDYAAQLESMLRETVDSSGTVTWP